MSLIKTLGSGGCVLTGGKLHNMMLAEIVFIFSVVYATQLCVGVVQYWIMGGDLA